ncbi:kanadaptin-like [Papaver somniferum]|uniref:kanadaptin-like n=1 Tax=Papaver somniferum TaxID=3469 RepID=UPI000E6FB87E|nr:kanadaptin-like [Papaver somniferum]
MKEAMGPPPPKNPNPSISSLADTGTQDPNSSSSSNSGTMKIPMGPPPPKNPNPSKIDAEIDGGIQENTTSTATTTSTANTSIIDERQSDDEGKNEVTESKENTLEISKPKPTKSSDPVNVTVPYSIPPWSAPPRHPFFFEVLKDGSIIDQFDVSTKGAYMFGRVDLCDFVLDHPTISRFHAVLQFKQSGDAYLYDLASTHGTSINKNQVKIKTYTDLHVGDVVRFGLSSRLYIFQGPSELMPPERDLNKIRSAKIREEAQDREASLRRAKLEASLADGISWGLSEDVIEEAEEVTEEITWQTYKGQLTERQEKTREKIIKRTEKIANMKKEIDAIRSKDISQGGLTQGQQTQIARNEQRMSQILEELESLEETLNESIQESLGARGGKRLGKNKGAIEDEDEASSDEDDFYDRTKKKPIQKAGESTSVETADTLLDKKDAIVSEIESKASLLSSERNKVIPEVERTVENGDDALDAYMTGLSSQLVLDTTTQLQAEISSLQTELDRILYLLKIADPTGEASKRRISKTEVSTSKEAGATSPVTEKLPVEKKKSSATLQKPKDGPILKLESPSVIATTQEPKPLRKDETEVTGVKESKFAVYVATKPVWLGATDNIKNKDSQQVEVPLDINEPDQFVDYKDRKKTLEKVTNSSMNPVLEIEDAAPGLIIRKRKHAEEPKQHDDKDPETTASLSVEAASTAADAVALLLKHKKGYFASEDMEENESIKIIAHPNKEIKTRRVVGPEKPNFLENDNPDYETWVPPEGQSGDGRTSLNERYGY